MMWDWQDWLIASLLSVLGLMAAGLIVGLIHYVGWTVPERNARDARLMQECIADHKEYECEALLKRDAPDAVPIIVPMVVR